MNGKLESKNSAEKNSTSRAEDVDNVSQLHEGCCKMWTRDWKGASTNFLEAAGIKWNCACPKTEPKREASNNL